MAKGGGVQGGGGLLTRVQAMLNGEQPRVDRQDEEKADVERCPAGAKKGGSG